MKTKVSPTIVGAFVIGFFALIILVLLSFGGINVFSKPQRFVVYFDESIHGLDLGSQVKLRGVRVGRVAALNVRYDDKKNSSVIAVVCEFSKDVVTDNNGVVIDVADRAELQTLVDRGLRAQLGVLGLATGLLFVELDFKDPKEYPVDERLKDPKYLVVPAVPSTISEFQASASEILASLKKVDFAGLSRGTAALIADTRRQLEGLDLKGLVDQLKKTGAQAETLMASADVKRTFENLNAAITELRATIAKLDVQVEPTGKDLRDTLAEAKKTIQSFSDTADAAKQFLATNAGLGDDVAITLSRLSDAADAVKRLADFIERNPSALIRGRKPPQ